MDFLLSIKRGGGIALFVGRGKEPQKEVPRPSPSVPRSRRGVLSNFEEGRSSVLLKKRISSKGESRERQMQEKKITLFILHWEEEISKLV